MRISPAEPADRLFPAQVSQWHVEAAACGSSQGSWVASGAIAAAGLSALTHVLTDVAAANLSAADESSCCDAVAAVCAAAGDCCEGCM